MWLNMLNKYNNTVDEDEESDWEDNAAVAHGKLLITIALVNETQK